MRAEAALLFIALVTGGAAADADELKPFQASYAWNWHGLTVAVSSLKLERRGDIWVYGAKSSPRGIGRVFAERPVQKSTFRLSDKGVEPLSYDADDGTPSTKRDAHVKFDWASGRITGIYENVKLDMALQPGIQDDLSIQIALVVELLAGHKPELFQLIDQNTVREYHYIREGEETIATPLGTVDTIVYRSEKTGSPRVTRFWCAPSRGFIPMRVEQKKGDDVQWSMELQSVKRD